MEKYLNLCEKYFSIKNVYLLLGLCLLPNPRPNLGKSSLGFASLQSPFCLPVLEPFPSGPVLSLFGILIYLLL